MEWLDFNGAESELKIIADFIAIAHVIGLSKPIVEQTIKLRRGVKIKLPDAIIASTALVYNVLVITRNLSDFGQVAGLVSINPHEKFNKD